MPLNDLIDVSKRQEPVIAKLETIMEDALATAAAISDNAFDEQRQIPMALVSSFAKDLEMIKEYLFTAASVYERRKS
tara:strand:- start:1620 stop:1850 length:231 start_codon:yes stop_codon:yes gene_type:complete